MWSFHIKQLWLVTLTISTLTDVFVAALQVVYTDYNIALVYMCYAVETNGECQKNKVHVSLLGRHSHLTASQRNVLISRLDSVCVHHYDLIVSDLGTYNNIVKCFRFEFLIFVCIIRSNLALFDGCQYNVYGVELCFVRIHFHGVWEAIKLKPKLLNVKSKLSRTIETIIYGLETQHNMHPLKQFPDLIF